jgi:hypothetical protein
MFIASSKDFEDGDVGLYVQAINKLIDDAEENRLQVAFAASIVLANLCSDFGDQNDLDGIGTEYSKEKYAHAVIDSQARPATDEEKTGGFVN